MRRLLPGQWLWSCRGVAGGAMDDESVEPVKPLPSGLAFIGMGTTIAGSVGLGVLAGVWVDGHWSSAPWGLIVGIVLGCAGAAVAVIGQVRKYL